MTREGLLDCPTIQATNSHSVSFSIDLHSILDLHAINTLPCLPSQSFLNTIKLDGKPHCLIWNVITMTQNPLQNQDCDLNFLLNRLSVRRVCLRPCMHTITPFLSCTPYYLFISANFCQNLSCFCSNRVKSGVAKIILTL